jgi:hypothetical protein
MEFSGEGVGVYAEAKGEYTRQLCQYLSSALQRYFLELLETAKEQEKETRKHLLAFQTLLEGISEWNIDKVQRETQRIAISTQCDYLEELLTAVFIAHTKVLSAIRLTNKQKKLQITIPKLEHFLHRTMTECARLLWTNTYLFAGSGTSIERQKNMRQIESIINEGILQGVRSMLPVKSILREYLTSDGDTDTDVGEDDREEEEDEEEEEEETEETTDVSGAAAAEPTGPAMPGITISPMALKLAPSRSTTPVRQAVEEEVDNSDEGVPEIVQPVPAPAHAPITKNTIVTVQRESPVTESSGPKATQPTIFVDTTPHPVAVARSAPPPPPAPEQFKLTGGDDEHINIMEADDAIPFEDDGEIPAEDIEFETL